MAGHATCLVYISFLPCLGHIDSYLVAWVVDSKRYTRFRTNHSDIVPELWSPTCSVKISQNSSTRQATG